MARLSHHTLDSTHIASGVVNGAGDRGRWSLDRHRSGFHVGRPAGYRVLEGIRGWLGAALMFFRLRPPTFGMGRTWNTRMTQPMSGHRMP